MGRETAECPKCLLEVSGRPILDWILDAFRQGGIDDIVFVGGYQISRIQQSYPQLRYYHNADWAENNVLECLLCAEQELVSPCVVSYSDILYVPGVLRELLASEAEITVVVDRDWKRRYKGHSHLLDRAEKAWVEDKRVTRIGMRLRASQTSGEFIGLAKLSGEGAQRMRAVYRELRESGAAPFQEAESLRRAYLSDMLQELIDRGTLVRSVDIHGDWIEIDQLEDLERARKQWPPSS